MHTTRLAAAATAVSLFLAASPALAEPPALDGTQWWTVDGDARVQFEVDAEGVLAGRLVWLRQDEERGMPTLDENNPDEALRARTLVGTPFVSGFTADGDEWAGGTIYDPAGGKTYASKISAGETDNELAVAGCVRVVVRVCRTQVWTRVEDALTES